MDNLLNSVAYKHDISPSPKHSGGHHLTIIIACICWLLSICQAVPRVFMTYSILHSQPPMRKVIIISIVKGEGSHTQRFLTPSPVLTVQWKQGLRLGWSQEAYTLISMLSLSVLYALHVPLLMAEAQFCVCIASILQSSCTWTESPVDAPWWVRPKLSHSPGFSSC